MLAQTADPHAYLKWPRLIMFNINGAVSIAATAVSARSFVVLNHDKATLAATIPGARLHTVNVVAITATMCAIAGLGSLYTAALSTAITLKWHRVETLKTIRVKEAIMATLLIVLLASAIVGTIIIVPRSAGVSGPYPSSVIKTIIESTGKSLAYKKSLAFPTLILVWICFGTTTICFILAALAARHIRKYGPENTTVGHAVSGHHQYGDSNDQVGRVATREEKSEKAHTRHVEHA